MRVCSRPSVDVALARPVFSLFSPIFFVASVCCTAIIVQSFLQFFGFLSGSAGCRLVSFFFFVLLFAVPHENMFPQLPASFLPLSTFMQTMNIYLHIASAPIPSSNLTDPTRRGQRIFKRRDDNLSKRGTRCFQTDTLVSHKADWSNELFWVPTNQRILRSNWKESTGWTHFFF